MLYLLPSNDVVFPNEWEKINTYILLWQLGCPVLKSVVLTEKKDLNYTHQVIEYLNSSECTLRFQYIKPSSSPIAGGNTVKITKNELNEYWNDARVLWTMEKTNRLTNLYGVNIAYNTKEENITFEVVGQGFDISDINRGDITPHQTIIASHPDYRSFYNEIWKGASIHIVSEKEYVDSTLIRRKKLKNMGLDTRSLEFSNVFTPMSLSLLEKLDKYAQRVFQTYNYSKDVVISCTVLENHKIVFWDIQTPEGKYAALHEK